MRIAIIQLGGVHEEVVPSLIHAIGSEHSVAVWLNEKCRDTRGDVFAEIPDHGAAIHYVALEGQQAWHDLGRDVRAFAPDVIIASTFQRQGAAEFLDGIGVPVLGVIHNIPMGLGVPKIVEMIGNGRSRPMALAHHVAATFHRLTQGAHIDRMAVVEPVHWGPPAGPRPPDAPRTIVVPGGVNATNRDFDGLMSSLKEGMAADLARRGMAVQILGGGPDRARLQAEVAAAGWQKVVLFAPLGSNGRVLYPDYLGALRAAWALLPLIPLTKTDYRDFKITSAIPTAMGMGLPLALDRWTASVYRCPCVEVAPTAEASLRALMDLDDDAHAALSASVLAYRDGALARNRTTMARLLSDTR